MSLIIYLKRLKKGIKVFLQTMKYGGYSEIHISNVEYDNILKGKRVLITGGGSGIGYAIAQKCVRNGADVIICGRNEEKLKTAISKSNSENMHYLVWDISKIEVIEENLEKCRKLLSSDIDILVNNAGVEPNEFFPYVTEKEWDRVYQTNSKGTYFLTELISKYWMDHNNKEIKKIIMIDSQGGFVGATYPYRMTKWDIRGLTRGLGLKMAQYNVLVNAIAPGVVKTDMQKFSIEQGDNFYTDQAPVSRVSLPEEVAELAIFMMSDACNYMVGQTILIDGGFSLH